MKERDLRLPGYNIEQALYQHDGRTVYRARRLADDQIVALETFDTEYPDRYQIAALHREGSISQRLTDVTGIRRIYELVPYGSGNLALVCELFENSLRSYTEGLNDKKLPLTEILHIAIELAHILSEVHSKDIVHKAITPEHLLYASNSGAIALTGFDIASELDQENLTEREARRLEGSLPYISPEQTGRMNRDLDYRSDYYSVGVVLYELLTGELPFRANDQLEWVHSHISRLPTPPHEINSSLPEPLSNIVLKLLAKSPEARYQSAEGLIHDLGYCEKKIAADQEIEPFKMGEKDTPSKFLVPQNLYGREHELDQLFRLFESAVSGKTEFCLVHGYSGVGKSALVNEIDLPLVRERGFLAQGKFGQYQHDEAYSALTTAFRSLVQQLLIEPEERLKLWRQQLLDSLTPNAKLVVDLVPELELIIGPQPDVAELPPAEAQNRQQLVLTAFLRTFAGEGHPVVLFLDDLHWGDTPTLNLLRRLITSRELSHLLLIGAYRSNEVDAGHPLRLLLDELHLKNNVHQLPITPLDFNSISDLVSDALKHPPEETREISEMVFKKTQGNPFFANELLRQSYKEGAIVRDSTNGRWNWELNDVQWSEVSDDVVKFMIDNLRKLPTDTQQVLQLAACIGGTFDLHTLATIYECSITATAAALLPALKLHAVLPLHSDYRLIGNSSELLDVSPSYRFQHDRVQQAAYALIVAKHLNAVHLHIGRLMVQHAGNSIPDERLIDIVGHLNEGRLMINAESERLELAELNLRAAKRAKGSSAYQSALNYLRITQELMPPDPWEETTELMRELAAETQQCAYLTGHISEADQWIDEMLEHARTDLERSDILATRTRQYATLGRMEDSIQSAIQGLAILGMEFTSDPTLEDIANQRHLVEQNLGARSIAHLVEAPLVEDPATLTAMRLLMEIFAAAFLSGSGNLFPYLVLKGVNLSLRHGNCPESAFIYAAYGMLLCGELNEPNLGYQYGKAGMAINERLDDLTLRSRVIYVYTMFVHHWSNHWSSLTPLFRKGIESGYQTGDLLYLAYSALDCVIWDPTLDLETAHRLHVENLEIVRECAYQDSLDSGSLFLQFQRNLLGMTHAPLTLSDDTFDEGECLTGMHKRQFMTGIANYHVYSAEIGLIYGNYEFALKHVRSQDKLAKSIMSLPQLARFQIVSFLTLASCYLSMRSEERRATRQRLDRDLLQMTQWANNCEVNFRHLQHLMEAELASLENDHERALNRYNESIDTAREHGFLHDEASAFERAARHLLSKGYKRAAEGYLRGAYRVYDRWGAQRKVLLMEQEFPVLREMASASQIAARHTKTGDLDLASVMKASRVISGEIVLDKLLKTTMDILLENAGGQWGCLVVRRDDELVMDAISALPRELAADQPPSCSKIIDREGNQIPIPLSLINAVLRTGEATVLDNATQDGQFRNDPYVQLFTPTSVLCVPLRRERYQAALYMENNLASGVFTEERVEIIRLLGAQALVAIENANLYEQIQDYSHTLEQKVAERTTRLKLLNDELQRLADRDGLTGVANRRRGDNYLDEVWTRLRREKQPLSVVMLDVDHFKAFNDNYGHHAGDDCLVTVAEVLSKHMKRPADMVARYGGEEFMLILPDTGDTGALRVAEEVRAAVESVSIPHAHSSVASVITVSAGIATAVPDGENRVEVMLREADVALYRAKKNGRNQVYSAPSIWETNER